MIIRENYLKKIRNFYDTDVIKIITGIRRCGKSELLKQIQNELIKKNVKKENIIYINFEDVSYDNITDYQNLHDYVLKKITNKDKYYLFFDEIQLVKSWEKAINSLRVKANTSIFITGSNSNLLSGELASLISGRYVTFKIMPFSFSEVIEFKNIKNRIEIEKCFDEYLMWGGLPGRFLYNDEEAIKTYLSDVFSSISIKDIIKRNNISDITAFERILEYIMTNPSQTFSPTKMLGELAKEGLSLSTKTIYDYLAYTEYAYINSRISTYDIRGKRILSRKDKYYLTDLGLGQIINRNKKLQLGAYLENIVFNELIVRGYEVSIGNNNGNEIDFIASKDKEKKYFQITYLLASEEIIKRELEAYSNIDDNYPKYVLSLDKYDFSDNGIIHMNVIDFLLDKTI